MKKTLLLLLILCTEQIAYSQTDFQKGYIITNQNDTIQGLIDYVDGPKKYRTCDFKKSLDPTFTNYRPGEIRGYRLAGDKYFESKNITIEGEPNNVFLELLVKGNASLYRFKNTFYIEKSDTAFYELTNPEQQVVIDWKKNMQKTNKHIGILNYLLSDCPRLRGKIQNTDLNQRALSRLVVNYNECVNTATVVFREKKPSLKGFIGVTAGVNSSQIEFNFAVPAGEHLNGFDRANSLMFGLSMDLLSPRISERVSIHADILYLSSEYIAINTREDLAIVRNDVLFELETLKTPIGFRYTFPGKNLIPYINLGFLNIIHLNSSNRWITETQLGQNIQTEERKALDVRDYQIGYWAGAGLKKAISAKLDAFCEFRFEQTDGFVENTPIPEIPLNSKITNLQILIGIIY